MFKKIHKYTIILFSFIRLSKKQIFTIFSLFHALIILLLTKIVFHCYITDIIKFSFVYKHMCNLSNI